jgi:hypothetical protein
VFSPHLSTSNEGSYLEKILDLVEIEEVSLIFPDKSEQKFPLMTSMGNMPHLTWNVMSVGPGHPQNSFIRAISPLKLPF